MWRLIGLCFLLLIGCCMSIANGVGDPPPVREPTANEQPTTINASSIVESVIQGSSIESGAPSILESTETEDGKTINVESSKVNPTVKEASSSSKDVADDKEIMINEAIVQYEKPSSAETQVGAQEEKKAPTKIVELESPDDLKRIVMEKKESTGGAIGSSSSVPATSPSPSPTIAMGSSTGASAVVAAANLTIVGEKTNKTLSGFNYASLDAGAMIMASNPESQGAGNLLIGDPDKYGLSPCSAQQWFVISLSEEILVATVEISNFERYSSSARRFQLWGAHKYPAALEEWSLLGEFERPTHRGTESFTLAQPSWSRYIKLQVLSIHGNEVYCTLSKVKVFGQTTLETLREDLAMSQLQIEAVRTTISDHQQMNSAHAAAAAIAAQTDLGQATTENCEISVDIGSQQPTSSTGPTANKEKTATTTTTAAIQSSVVVNDTVSTSPPAGVIKEELEGQPQTPPPIPQNVPAASESPSADALSLSIVGGKSSPASVDSIFKTLMEKVKGVEIDISVLNACLETNNEKVKTALEFLDKGLKDVKEELSALNRKRSEESGDRTKILEDELNALATRQATLESISFFVLFFGFVAILRGRR